MRLLGTRVFDLDKKVIDRLRATLVNNRVSSAQQMGPKKKSPGKKKADGPAKLTDKDLLRRAEAELVALQRVLEQKTADASEAREREQHWRELAQTAEARLLEEKKLTLAICSDMTRQAKVNQELMAKKVIAANELVQHQQAQLTDRDATIQRLTHLLDQQKHQHASQVAEMTKRQVIMQHDFKESLQQVADRVHLHNQRHQHVQRAAV